MIARRIGQSLRTVCRFSLRRVAPFCLSSSDHPRFSSVYSDAKRGGSAVYRHALKFQRPTTIKWQAQLENSVNFIGTVVRPLERSNVFGVYTLLHVKNSHSDRGFDILLAVGGDMAQLCQKHLKPNDFIYVTGQLHSFSKVDKNGKLCLRYKVVVEDLNYVRECGQGLAFKKSVESKSRGGEAGMEKYENRFYLWHVYFANPYEWWDNRKKKFSPGAPDFKHKSTGEALWLDPKDPPWVKKQLQRIDSMMEERGSRDLGSLSRVSTWVYDE